MATAIVENKPALQLARVRGSAAVIGTSEAEICWHCKGAAGCGCAFCATAQFPIEPGDCRACFGTGSLAWPEGMQFRRREAA
jgi:hypothetical protein